MGCDGGTIPKRDELVKKKKKPEQKDKESELRFRWRHCAISQQPLRNPIVACGLGRLYCKEAVLEGLLDRSKLPETAQHITSLKDVKELQLTPNPAFPAQQNGDKGESGCYVDHRAAPYTCPVIGVEMSGKFGFSFAWGCGCVVSDRALREVPTQICHKCQKAFSADDLVSLNAEGETLELMKSRLEARRKAVKATKAAKKGKKQTEVTLTSDSSSSASPPATEDSTSLPATDTQGQELALSVEKAVEPVIPVQPVVSVVEPSKPAEVVVVKVESEKSPSRKRSRSPSKESKHDSKKERSDRKDRKDNRYDSHHKSSQSDRKSSRRDDRSSRSDHKSSRSDEKSRRPEHKSGRSDKSSRPEHKSGKLDATADPAYKKAKSEYSVAKDPKATSVYKSLFTSHEDAKSQTKAHWITYNPFYN